MAAGNYPIIAFNRGIISKRALARTDLKRVELSAEIQRNWMPSQLGSMMLRPGLIFVTDISGATYSIPFIFSNSDTAILTIGASILVPYVNETAVAPDSSVTTGVVNGNFATDLSSWTDADDAGAVSSWASVGGSGALSLVGTGTAAARRKQQVTVAAGNQNKEHTLWVKVLTGKATFSVGSADLGDEYITRTELHEGDHNLSFTPSGNFFITISSPTQYATQVQLCELINGSDNFELNTPPEWVSTGIDKLRWDQSADVIYIACDGAQPRKIERRGIHSWSIVKYQPEDGPFRLENTDDSITLTTSGLSGDIGITSSQALFKSTHVGALFKITSNGQIVQSDLSAENTFTDSIRVTGVGSQRVFAYNIIGTWVGTLTVQQSFDNTAWLDYTPLASITVNRKGGINDTLDNQIVYYRVGFKTGHYTSGTATINLTYVFGGSTGIVRITGFTNSKTVAAQVLSPLGGISASPVWSEGAWSDYRGWPTAVALYEGRLWWAGRDKVWGSISDAFESFDETQVGDSGPISRSIGSGPVDVINWLLPLLRLIAGGEAAEHSIRSTSLDEPLTSTNFNIKQPSSQGSSAVPAVKIDTGGLFVNKTGTRLFDLTMENAVYSYDYQSSDLTLLCPEVGAAGFKRIAVQRLPDTRIHCVRADGTAAILLYNPVENVKCWVEVSTGTNGSDGFIQDVFVMPNPGGTEDKVYYSVSRGAGQYLERWATEDLCVGATLNFQADSLSTFAGSGGQLTFDLPAHLQGNLNVVVWADGKDYGTIATGPNSGGTPHRTFTLPDIVTSGIVGLGYTAQYKSTKLAYGAQEGTALTQKKRLSHLGIILSNAHYQGVKYGADFDTLDDLPLVENGIETPANTIWADFDFDAFEFNDTYTTDSRLCLQAQAPRPCTVLAAIVGLATNEKSP